MRTKILALLDNSRFWILAIGVTLSILIAGFVQLEIPSGSLQLIRMEQYFGFISLILLYLALLASPLTAAWPQFSLRAAYLHARRAIGVLACFYALLHVYITFFKQLDGFGGVKYLNHTYLLSLICGVSALCILCVLALTSMDWVIRRVGFPRWKRLQRFVYIAGIAILIHVIVIGTHYTGLSLFGIVTYLATILLLALEAVRITRKIRQRKGLV